MGVFTSILMAMLSFFTCERETQALVNDHADEKPKYLISYEAKGLNVPWDVGVTRSLVENIPDLANEQVVFAGSSSGSLVAATFSCYGLGTDALAFADKNVRKFDSSVVNESFRKYIRMAFNLETEFSHSKVTGIIDSILKIKSVSKEQCKPNFPLVIVAGNSEIIDRNIYKRNGKKRRFQGVRTKYIDLINNSVLVHGLSGKEIIGKSCTYFVDPYMHEKMSVLPEHERLCDLRLMEDASDMKDAVLASISEPTYYPPYKERLLKRLTSLGRDRLRRRYRGGLAMLSVVQDIKRTVPDIYAVSSGTVKFGDLINKKVAEHFTVRLNDQLDLSRYWYDAVIYPNIEHAKLMKQRKMSIQNMIHLGYSYANSCFDGRSCKPRNYAIPLYNKTHCPKGASGCEPQKIDVQRGIPHLFK